MNDHANIADRIKSLRSKLGLSQAALAKRMGMRPSQLCKIEQGYNGLSASSIRRLTEALGVTVSELMGEASAGGGARSEPEARAERAPADLVRVLADDLPAATVAAAAKVAAACEERANAAARGQVAVSQSSLQLVYPYGVDEDAAELLARDMRHALGIGCAPIVDLDAILEMRGVNVVSRAFAKQFQSAAFFDLPTRVLTVVLNSENTPQRNAYRLAYELGGAAVFAMSGFSTVRDEGSVHRLLRRFSAAFLMPEEAVRMDVARSGIAPDRWTFRLLVMMKSHFAVSAEAYALRLESLGLIAPELRIRLRDRLRAHYRNHPKAMEPKAKDASHLAIRLELAKGGGK